MPSSGRSRSNSRQRPHRRSWRPSFLSRSRSARPRTGVQHDNASGVSDQPYHSRGFNSLRRHLRLPRHRPVPDQPAGEGADQVRRQRHPRGHGSFDLRRADTGAPNHSTVDAFPQFSRRDLDAIQRRGPLSSQETDPSDPIYQTGRLLNPRRHWPFNLRRVNTRAPDRPTTNTFPQLSSTDLEAIRRGGIQSSQENRRSDPIYQRPRLSNPSRAEKPSDLYFFPPPPGHLRKLNIFSVRTPDLPLPHGFGEEGGGNNDNVAETPTAPANPSDGQGSQHRALSSANGRQSRVLRTLAIRRKDELKSHATEPAAGHDPSSPSDAQFSFDPRASRDSDIIINNTLDQRMAALAAAIKRERIKIQLNAVKEQERMLQEARERLPLERERQRGRAIKAMEKQNKRQERRLRADRRRQRLADTIFGRRVSTISGSYNAFRQGQEQRRLSSRFFKMVDQGKQKSRQKERSRRHVEILEAKKRRQDWIQCERNARRKELAKRFKESSLGKAFEKFRGKLSKKKPSTESQTVTDVLRRSSDPGETAAPREDHQNIQVSQRTTQPRVDDQSPLEAQREAQDDARRADNEESSKSSSSSSSDSDQTDHQPPHDDSSGGPPPGPSGGDGSSKRPPAPDSSNTGGGTTKRQSAALSYSSEHTLSTPLHRPWHRYQANQGCCHALRTSHTPHHSSPLRVSEFPPMDEEPSSCQKTLGCHSHASASGSPQKGKDSCASKSEMEPPQFETHPVPVVSMSSNHSIDSDSTDGMPHVSLQHLTQLFVYHSDKLRQTYGELKRRELDVMQHSVDCMLPVLEDAQQRLLFASQQNDYFEVEPVDEIPGSEADGLAQKHVQLDSVKEPSLSQTSQWSTQLPEIL
ncbi:hypothetical protein IWX90DRAFT_289753 [Phyllosticta citrichinensis]|uniref:Uncharacterized protein n=1 Tax=Phyllosticta citrichinensis TaxID=1130410 RepID=A0ABR1XPR4_9PEZI